MNTKHEIISFLSEKQVTEFDRLTRSDGYQNYYLNDDDAPVYRYDNLQESLGYSRDTLKIAMNQMKLDGLVELVPAVDYDGMPNGSGWSLTEKGMHYAVDNNLVVS